MVYKAISKVNKNVGELEIAKSHRRDNNNLRLLSL